MGTTALELVLSDDVQRIFDHFTSLLGIRIAYFTPGFEELVAGLHKPSCAFCRTLREGLGLDGACRAQDRAKLSDALRTGRLTAYTCHAGLDEAIVPVALGGTNIGFVMIGQYRSTTSMRPRIRASARRAGLAGVLRATFADVPYFAPAKTRHVLGMFELLVGSLTSRHMIRARTDEALERILAVLRERPERPPTLAEVARLAGRSTSAISHAFRGRLGTTFKRAQIEARLDRADELFAAEPDLTVKEVAYRLGYDDPLYFSRIYRKCRGRPPSTSARTRRRRIR